jgi:ribosome-associated toxin RatA of RatAB toxin-antitoxin module
MGLSRAEHTEAIPAEAKACFDAIVDYETFPRWQNAVEEAEVLERDRKGLAELVRFQVDGKVRKVRYTLRYHYDRPRRIWWDFIEGEGIKHLEGEYVFEQRGSETLATYRIGMDPGAGIPGPVARRVGKQLCKRSVQDLAGEVIRRKGMSAETEERQIGRAHV